MIEDLIIGVITRLRHVTNWVRIPARLLTLLIKLWLVMNSVLVFVTSDCDIPYGYLCSLLKSVKRGTEFYLK